jgi:hypothetical protein
VTPPPSPEFRLLAACCRWPTAPDVVAQEAAAVIDWARFVQLVRRHRVFGLVHRALMLARVIPPEPQATHIAAMAREQGRASLACAVDTAAMATMLEGRGIAPLFFKGATLALRAYGDLAIKQSVDIDILVRPDEAKATLSAIEAQGFRCIQPARPLSARQFGTMLYVLKSATLFNPERRKLLDVHWRLATNAALLKPVVEREELLLAGRNVATLKVDDLAIYLAAHGAGHGWVRLKWLADFNALLSTMSVEAIAALRARARLERIDSCLESALALCERLLGGVSGAAPSVLSRRGRGLVALADDLMRGPDEVAEQHQRPAQGMVQRTAGTFLKKRGLRFQAINLWLATFNRDDALRVGLPRYAAPLYVVIGPSMRLARQLGRASRLAYGRVQSRPTPTNASMRDQ